MTLLVFVLICYGMTSILVWGKIFDSIRPDWNFFHCSQCVGFWVGVFVSIFFQFPLVGHQYWLINQFLCGCISAGTSYMLDKLFGDDGINININFKSD